MSSRCPGLKELVLGYVYLHGTPGLCVRSDSLERLEIFGDAEFHGWLEVDAPKRSDLCPRGAACPRLASLLQCYQRCAGMDIPTTRTATILWMSGAIFMVGHRDKLAGALIMNLFD